MSVALSTTPPGWAELTIGEPIATAFLTIDSNPPGPTGPEGPEGPRGFGVDSVDWPDFTLIFDNKLV